MAYVKLSGLITDLKGKLGGSYFQTKKGQVSMNTINANNKSKNSTNAAVNTAKVNVSTVAKTWKTLTNTQRAAWQSLASTLTRTNKNGVTYTPNGYQIFNEYNLNLISLDLDIQNTPNEATITKDVNEIIIGPGTAPDKFTIVNNGFNSSLFQIVVFATRVQSKGVAYPRGSYKKIAVMDGNTGDMSLDTAYVSAFGQLNSGDTVFFKTVVILTENGVRDGSKLTKADAG